MPVGKIAVLRSSLDTLLQGLEPEDVPPPFAGGQWKGYRGANGAVLHATALDGGALVVPFGFFESAEEVALAVRGALGAALDRHDEARGLFIVAGEDPPSEGSYDAVVGGAGAFVPVPAPDDSRLAKEAGWSFAAAASAFSSPDAKKKVEEHAETDPFASAKATFDTKLAAREERGTLRRTLSAALNHEVDHSALGKTTPEEEQQSAFDKAAEQLRRATSANPDKVTELVGVLRSTIDKEIARAEPIDESRLPKIEEGDAPEGAKPEGDLSAKE
jgi:hypothetical protein